MKFNNDQFIKKRWMQNLFDLLPVSQISIPGSHDSAAMLKDSIAFKYKILKPIEKHMNSMTQTQRHVEGDIRNNFIYQLNSGIRYFDLRCYLNKKTNALKLSHGGIDQKIFLIEIFNVLNSFLEENPSEIIFIKLKHEGMNFASKNLNYFSNIEKHKKISKKEFSSKYLELISKMFHRFNIDYNNNIPKVKDCRGKIFVFHDDCFDYDINQNQMKYYKNFIYGINLVQLKNQGLYKKFSKFNQFKRSLNSGTKYIVDHAMQNLRNARAELSLGNSSAFYFTSTNATGMIHNGPILYAEKVAKEFIEPFQKFINLSKKPFGILTFDFVLNETFQLYIIDLIISSNIFVTPNDYRITSL